MGRGSLLGMMSEDGGQWGRGMWECVRVFERSRCDVCKLMF
jgi:hypothetical protein